MLAASRYPRTRHVKSLLLLLLAITRGHSASCGQSLVDATGAFWYLNLTALQADADYVVRLLDGTDINVNFCAPAKQFCLPDGRVSGPELVRGVATRQWGAAPAPGEQCFLASDTDHRFPLACTRDCEVMGAGAVGTLSGDWDFIDAADPRIGFRATHRAPPPPPPANATTASASAAAATAAWQPPCGMDEWGNPQPRRVVFDFVCDASVAGAVIDAPTELNDPGNAAQLQCATTLRVRSAAPCFNFSWQPGAWDECQAEVPGAALATRRRAIGCAAPGTTATDGRFCEQLGAQSPGLGGANKPTDVEFCQLPAPCTPPSGKQGGGGGGGGGDAQGGATGTPPAKGSGVAGVGGVGGVGVCVTQPNAWEQAAAVCSALSLLGLLLGAMMVVSPMGGVPSMGLDRSRGGGGGGGGGVDDEDHTPLAYAAPRATGQRVPYDYEAF